MAYDSTDELPEEVQRKLPGDAQGLFRNAYNEAYGDRGREADPEEYDDADSPTEVAHEKAWNAVEAEYEEVDGEYVQKGGGGMQYS